MKTNENTAVSARVQNYSFNNEELCFSIDHGIVKEAAKLDESVIDALVGFALKTLIHRSSQAPKGGGEDATEWLLEALQGGSQSGRYRVTTDDREKLANCHKQFAMAPEQTLKQFNANNAKYQAKLEDFIVDGELQDEPLLKFYVRRRAAIDAEKKASKSML